MRQDTKQGITPGLWRTGDMFNTVFGPNNGTPCPEVIATVAKGNKANAQAIAAVPELIAALRVTRQAIADLAETAGDVPEFNENGFAYEANRIADSALAKAGVR